MFYILKRFSRIENEMNIKIDNDIQNAIKCHAWDKKEPT